MEELENEGTTLEMSEIQGENGGNFTKASPEVVLQIENSTLNTNEVGSFNIHIILPGFLYRQWLTSINQIMKRIKL